MEISNSNVQIWTLYATVFIALVGFIFNIVSLWQTKKATEDMAKPFVNAFVDAYGIKDQQRVYVIKNFGQTPAYIIKIEIDGELDRFNKYNFQSLVGNMLAPGQKLTSSMDRDFKSQCRISITYKDSKGKIYFDTFKLDPMIGEDFAYTLTESSRNHETATAIRQSTMALLRDFH